MLDKNTDATTTRRTVLKGAGAASLFSLAGFTGAASAHPHGYGRGNGIGVFLNEEAELKETPIWRGHVADMTGQSTATIDVGAPTSHLIPDDELPPELPDELPFAFDPLVAAVSPGTEVTWDWRTLESVGIPASLFVPIAHNVVSIDESGGSPVFESALVPQPFTASDPAVTFSHTFEERGTYLYYCGPHGAPHGNIFGMRGAVVVR